MTKIRLHHNGCILVKVLSKSIMMCRGILRTKTMVAPKLTPVEGEEKAALLANSLAYEPRIGGVPIPLRLFI